MCRRSGPKKGCWCVECKFLGPNPGTGVFNVIYCALLTARLTPAQGKVKADRGAAGAPSESFGGGMSVWSPEIRWASAPGELIWDETMHGTHAKFA